MLVKQIPNYQDYLVSEAGDVFSKKYGKIKKLKPRLHEHGYPMVALYTNGKVKNCCVHRLVLMAFDRMPKPHEVSRHKDGDPSNSYYKNLEWGTIKDNIDDRTNHGKTARNEKHGMCKVTNNQVLEIRELYKTGKFTQEYLGEVYKVTHVTIGYIINNKGRVI